jgi:hypothetical protein
MKRRKAKPMLEIMRCKPASGVTVISTADEYRQYFGSNPSAHMFAPARVYVIPVAHHPSVRLDAKCRARDLFDAPVQEVQKEKPR